MSIGLEQYVSGEKNLGLFERGKVRRAIEQFVLDELEKKGISEPNYQTFCIVQDFNGYDIDTMGEHVVTDGKVIIRINKRLMDNIGTVATQEDVERATVVDRERLTRLDLFLTIFRELEYVKQAGLSVGSYADAQEIALAGEEIANLGAVERTIKYFEDSGIKLSEAELEILRRKNAAYKRMYEEKVNSQGIPQGLKK